MPKTREELEIEAEQIKEAAMQRLPVGVRAMVRAKVLIRRGKLDRVVAERVQLDNAQTGRGASEDPS